MQLAQRKVRIWRRLLNHNFAVGAVSSFIEAESRSGIELYFGINGPQWSKKNTVYQATRVFRKKFLQANDVTL